MKMLLKYEFRKTWTAKLIVLGIAAVAEIAFLIGVAIGDARESGAYLIGISAALLVMIASFGVLFIGLQSIVILHRDMNTKQGYMLYMTPRNSYQILGAKFLENGISLVLAGAAFFLLGMLDVTLLFTRIGMLDQLWSMLQDILRTLNAEIELNARSMLVLVMTMLASWLATVAIACLSDIISSALLNGKKYNGALAFLFFVLLSVLMNYLQQVWRTGGMAVTSVLLIRAGIAVAYAVLVYFISAYIMDHYLSV